MIRWKIMDYYSLLWTLISIVGEFVSRTSCLTVDNQLVSARNDCFERIALEAMMPFEKTFRTEDTNSLRMCKEKCLQEGDKCQSISFGVHRRGNGTCQLSKEKFSSTGGRPNGVIFDPDFDLYARKTNCFDLAPDQADHLAETNGYGSSLAPTTPVFLSSGPSAGTPVLIVDPTPTYATTVHDDNTHYPTSPTSGYGDTSLYTQASPTTLGPTSPTTLGGSNGNGDRLYFSHDVYPLFKYPTLYEPNYPAPNQDVYIPGGYASNAQEVSGRPTSYDGSRPPIPPPHNQNGPPKPMFGLGYGNGYSYGLPESYNPSTMRPQDSGYSSDSHRPNMNSDPQRPGSGYDNTNRDPLRPSAYDNTTPPYYPRPGNDQSYPYGPSRPSNDRYPSPPYSSRPENDHSSPPPYGPRPSNGSSSPYGPRPETDRVSAPPYGPRPDNDRGGSPYGSRPENDRGPAPPYGLRPENDRGPLPPYGSRPNNDQGPTTPYGSRPDNDRGPTSAYGPRPANGHSSVPPYGHRPSSQGPGDGVDYTNRPDAPHDGGTARPPTVPPYGPGYSNSYDNNYMRRNGTAAGHPDGYNDDKKINTYFNPDDYLPGSKKKRPGAFEDNDRLDSNRTPMKGNDHATNDDNNTDDDDDEFSLPIAYHDDASY